MCPTCKNNFKHSSMTIRKPLNISDRRHLKPYISQKHKLKSACTSMQTGQLLHFYILRFPGIYKLFMGSERTIRLWGCAGWSDSLLIYICGKLPFHEMPINSIWTQIKFWATSCDFQHCGTFRPSLSLTQDNYSPDWWLCGMGHFYRWLMWEAKAQIRAFACHKWHIVGKHRMLLKLWSKPSLT